MLAPSLLSLPLIDIFSTFAHMDSSQYSTEQKRSAADVVSDVFPPFDHRSRIVSPFEQDGLDDAKFQASKGVD